MDDLNFDWDESKNRSNKRKHGISFEEAQSVFYDENARLISDPDHSEFEDRYILLGLNNQFNILVVSHVYRKTETSIRIISARKANSKERKIYKRFMP